MIVSKWISKKIKPGELWATGKKQDPWTTHYGITVVILDVQDGWVKYCWVYDDGTKSISYHTRKAFEFWILYSKISS